MIDPQDWMTRGACSVSPSSTDEEARRALDVFFGHGGHPEKAKAVCADCPVKDACREYAIVNRIDRGVWGGLGEEERVKLRSARARRARKQKQAAA